MSALEDFFFEYGGDYETTMQRFMGNEALYFRILPKLFQDDNLHKLGQTLASGNLDSAFEAAHTLKGVSANLGLTPLYDAVCAIVEPLRQRQTDIDYPNLYRTVQVEFQRINNLWEQLKQ